MKKNRSNKCDYDHTLPDHPEDREINAYCSACGAKRHEKES